MSNKVTIKLDTSKYQTPTQDDLEQAKDYVKQRNAYANVLESKIDTLLAQAAKDITNICYKYNIEAEDFRITANDDMFNEVSEVMDELEEEILKLIEEYSTACSKDRDRIKALIAFIITLGRQNRNLRGTLENYLNRYLYDLEALIASMKLAKYGSAEAVTKIVSNLHNVYSMPEVRKAMSIASSMSAMYIQSKGIHYDFETGRPTVGLSINGATNVTNMAKITLSIAWMRNQLLDFIENGAAGYYQLRGSNYPCKHCDDEVGFHPGIENISSPLPHPHCMCYRIPIFPI